MPRFEILNPDQEAPGWGRSRVGRDKRPLPPSDPQIIDTSQDEDAYTIVTIAGLNRWERVHHLVALLNANPPA